MVKLFDEVTPMSSHRSAQELTQVNRRLKLRRLQLAASRFESKYRRIWGAIESGDIASVSTLINQEKGRE